MMRYSLNAVEPDITQVLSEDGDRVFCRALRLAADSDRSTVLVVLPATGASVTL